MSVSTYVLNTSSLARVGMEFRSFKNRTGRRCSAFFINSATCASKLGRLSGVSRYCEIVNGVLMVSRVFEVDRVNGVHAALEILAVTVVTRTDPYGERLARSRSVTFLRVIVNCYHRYWNPRGTTTTRRMTLSMSTVKNIRTCPYDGVSIKTLRDRSALRLPRPAGRAIFLVVPAGGRTRAPGTRRARRWRRATWPNFSGRWNARARRSAVTSIRSRGRHRDGYYGRGWRPRRRARAQLTATYVVVRTGRKQKQTIKRCPGDGYDDVTTLPR